MNETSGERLARLLALVPWLRVNDGVTIEETARHFSVSEQQLTTDLWQLIVCGIPGYGPDQLVDIQFWDDDRIHVLDPVALERPLRLSGDEAAALLVALRVLAQVPGNHDRSALRSAMAKLESTIASAGPGVEVDMTNPVRTELADAITDAIASGTALDIDYSPGDRDVITRRRIEPVHSYVVDGRVYIEAYCHQAQAVRTFRLDRIESATPAGAGTRAGSGPGTDDETDSRPGGVTEGAARPEHVTNARIAVDPEAAWVWDTDPVEPDGAEWPDRGWPTGTIGYASEGWLVRYVLGRAGRVVVLGPEPVRTAVARQAQAKLAAMRDDDE